MKELLTRMRDRLLPIVLSQGAALLCGLAGVRIVSRWVPPAALGGYGVFLTFTTLGLWVVHAGLIKFITRHWASAIDQSALLQTSLKSWARKLIWLALAATAAACTLTRESIASTSVVAVALFVSAALIALGVLVQSALQAARLYWTDFAVSITGSVTRTFLPPLLFLGFDHAFGLYLGFGLHSLCFAAAALWMVRRTLPQPASNTTYAPTVAPVYDGAFFAVLSLVGWMLMGINRWIVAGCFGEATAGFFTLAGNLAQIVPAMLGAIFVQYFQPGIFASPQTNVSECRALARRVDLIALAYTVLALAGVAAVHFLTPWFIGPWIDERYRTALLYIAGTGSFGAAVITAQFFHMLLLAAHRERACGPVDLSAALVLILGGLGTAFFAGEKWFLHWLLLTPLVPWILNRPLARWYLLGASGNAKGPDKTKPLSRFPSAARRRPQAAPADTP
jgi:O-antigen/teichoic acid export membrane protein